MHLDKFKNYLTLNKDSKFTVNTYYNQLKVFFDKYREFNQKNIDDFLQEKIEQNASENTINLFIYSFKVYSKFAKIHINFPKPKRIKTKIQFYINETQLNDVCIKLNIVTNSAFKWSVILKFMFYTGVRLKELIQLKRKHIDLDKQIILIKDTKNKEERLIPFSKHLKELLIKYFNIEPEETNAFNTTRASIVYICKTIKEYFNLDIHPHSLRHSACHYFLKITNNKYDVVQKIMGHKNIEQTISYSRLTQSEAINFMHNTFKNLNK